MNTYYDIRLTKQQYNALLMLAETGLAKLRHARTPAIDDVWAILCNVEPHPNIDDVHQYEAEHSGFKGGETVLLEVMIINSYERVSTVAIHHFPTPIMVSNNLIYHKD